jgi:hypothetical protein
VVAAERAAATRIVSPGRGTPALSSATTTEMIQDPWTWTKPIVERDVIVLNNGLAMIE